MTARAFGRSGGGFGEVLDALSDSGVIAGLTRAGAVTLAEQLNSGILSVPLSLAIVTAYTEARPVIEEEE